MQLVGSAFMADGMAGIVAPLEPDYKVGLGAVVIGYLAFAFIAPLGADNDQSLPVVFYFLFHLLTNAVIDVKYGNQVHLRKNIQFKEAICLSLKLLSWIQIPFRES